MKQDFNNYIRLKRPKAAFKCDYEGSRSAAIEMFCETCMGGSRSLASKCQSYTCPLWRYRPNSDKETPPGIPSKEDYARLIDEFEKNDGRVAQARKMAKELHAKEDE